MRYCAKIRLASLIGSSIEVQIPVGDEVPRVLVLSLPEGTDPEIGIKTNTMGATSRIHGERMKPKSKPGGLRPPHPLWGL